MSLRAFAQYDSIRREVSEAVQQVFETQRFVLGDEVAEFEREVAGYCDARLQKRQ